MSWKHQVRRLLNRVMYAGSNRVCSVCGGHARRFLPFGVVPREDAQCPFCGALERHRLTIRFLRAKTDLFDGQPRRFLHIAPESCLRPLFMKAAGPGYLSADLMATDVMEKMDITQIHYPADTFDVVYCSHVFEHVPDDRLAMRELCRVLRPTGFAVLNVPITATRTFEDPTVTDPKERERLFGQVDHVRCYGPDYSERLEEAGFVVNAYGPSDLYAAGDVERHGLGNGAAGSVYYCTKRR